MPDLDLFGNPVAGPNRPATPDPTPDPMSVALPVNDMDLVEAVLSSAGNVGYHLASAGEKVYRCAGTRVEPVPGYEDTAVHQLIDARYLEVTNHRTCPFAGDRMQGHGRPVRLSKHGRDALSRWKAYQRPSTWGRPHGT